MLSKHLEKNLKGVAGVHFVVAQLSLRGFVALPTIRNIKSFDIIAFQPNLSKVFFLQVKSTDKPKSGWPVYTVPRNENWQKDLKKSVSLGNNSFYIFVELPIRDRLEPDFYIVPSRDVVDMLIKLVIRAWQREKPQPAKHLLAWGYGGLEPEIKKKYRNRWELLT